MVMYSSEMRFVRSRSVGCVVFKVRMCLMVYETDGSINILLLSMVCLSFIRDIAFIFYSQDLSL